MAKRRNKLLRPRQKWLLITLLALSFATLFLPRAWTGGWMSLVQVLVPFQHGVNQAADLVAHGLSSTAAPVTAEVHESVLRERDALLHQTVALSLRIADLEKEVGLLSASRLWDVNGHRIGARGQLIPARVLVEDILAWRDSRLLSAGTLQGVQRGAPVTSRQFSINHGSEDGVHPGMAILLAETLVGFVEQTGPYTSRVKLLSDLTAQRKVLIGRFSGQKFAAGERYFWLVGRGNRLMRIRDVDRRDVQSGAIAVGDLVLSDPDDSGLPASMTVGVIAEIEPDRDNPLLSILSVKGSVDVDALRQVYIFDPDSATEK